MIVTDDLGFSDIGAFGGEIETPNLDQLALSGLRLTGFHTAPACSPTRAMLLTGSDSHRVGLGAMAEVMQENQRGLPGYEGHLRADTATLAERFAAGGYRTLFSGKWHLGEEAHQDPHARGFQHSFSRIYARPNHFGAGLADVPEDKAAFRENGVKVTSLPADFYSSDYFADKLVEQIRSSKAGADGDKPFFAYLAFTAPHFPLQAPAETVAKYKGRYDAGYEALREKRLVRQRALGLIDASVQPHRLLDAPMWESLSESEREKAARKMEIYAAMVDRLDVGVGRVIAALKETGEFDNTVILFLSDNGAEGIDVSTNAVTGLNNRAQVASSDIDSLGTTRSFVSYGRGWAQAATAPSYRFKSYATEGGTRVVAFLSGPVVTKPGTISGAFKHVTDVVPTFAELAGLPIEPESFAGRAIPPIDGLSWAASLRDGSPVFSADRAVGTELFGSRSLRQGDWKIVDIADAALIAQWESYAKKANVVLPVPPIRPNPPLNTEGE
ncbi:MAG: arylsulfatase [Burkholderiales bacterium]|nr:MAG: arylsulfatase [Burkholderiales bacterium]